MGRCMWGWGRGGGGGYSQNTGVLVALVIYNQFRGRHQHGHYWNWDLIWNHWNWIWNFWYWNWNLLWVLELELKREEWELNWKNGVDPNPAYDTPKSIPRQDFKLFGVLTEARCHDWSHNEFFDTIPVQLLPLSTFISSWPLTLPIVTSKFLSVVAARESSSWNLFPDT